MSSDDINFRITADSTGAQAAITHLRLSLGALPAAVAASAQAATAATSQLESHVEQISQKFSQATIDARLQGEAYVRVTREMGGAAALTADQHKEVSRAIHQANEAYRLIGQQAPPHMKTLSAELERTAVRAKDSGKMLDMVKIHAAGIFAGFSVINAVQGLKAVATGALDTAGMLTDLAAQTGIQASALDRLRLAALPAGVELSKITDVIAQMSDRLVSGDKGAIGALDRMKLSADVLTSSAPDSAFLSILEALNHIPDPMERTKTAFDVFGGRAKEVLRLVNAEFIENAKHGKSWSEGTIAQLDNAGDAWGQLYADVESATGKIIAQGYKLAHDVQYGQWATAFRSLKFVLGGSGAIGPTFAPFAFNPATPSTFTLGGATGAGGRGYQSPGLEGFGPNPGIVNGVSNYAKELERQAKLAKKAAEEQAKLNAEMLDQRGWDAHVTKLQAESKALAEMGRMAVWAAQGLQSVRQTRGAFNLTNLQMGLPEVVSGIPSNLTDYAHQVTTPGINGVQVPFWPGAAGSSAKVSGFSDLYGWNRIGGQVPNLLQSVFSGGGNKSEGLGAVAGGMGGQALGGMFTALAKSGFLTTGLSTTLGMAGNILPVVGPIIGAFLGKAIGGLFGPSRNALADRQATANIQSTQAGLISRYGSIENIKGMTQAGAELAAGWGHQGRAGEAAFMQQVAAFEASLKEQNRLLTEQQRLEGEIATEEERRAELADRLVVKQSEIARIQSEYGIKTDQLGGPLSQQRTTADATKFVNDLDTMRRAAEQAGGEVDWGGVLTGMREELSVLVQDALRLKTALPENLRPFIEELARSGQLVDENGEKITDLSQIKWGAKVETEAEKTTAAMAAIDTTIQGLRDALGEVVTALRDLLPAAAKAGADAITDEMNRAGRTVRTTTDGMRDDFAATEEAATGTAHGHSPTGIKEISIVAKQAGEDVKQLGKISYQTFSTVEETAAYWAHTALASFDKLGGMLQSAAEQWEDLRATPEQRQVLALNRAYADQRAALDPFKDDPRYADALALLERTHALEGAQLRAEQAKAEKEKNGTTETKLQEKIARVREKWAQAMELGRQLAFTQGQKLIGQAAMGSTLGVLSASTEAQHGNAARDVVRALIEAQPRALDGQPLAGSSPTFVMHVNTWNADGMEDAVRSDIWPRLLDMLRRNDGAALTQLRLALGMR